MELTDQQKEMINHFQMYQQQLQSVLIQKETLRLQTMEIEKALEELNVTKEEKAYKISGQIMISKTVDELKKELNENKEVIEVKMKSLGKVEEKINTSLKELQEKLKGIE